MIRRAWRWLFQPTPQPFTPGFVAFLGVLALAVMAAGLWFSWHAMETGNGHVLLVVAGFLLVGLADLTRRVWRR